ncbi:MAG TPA: D-2-hydroxyacid dehydrogenase [Anaerolineaceae bacterium]|nr:D-2-hydroxyacid dehydrogenase [Anaerolineaceae bacterium]
MANIVEVLITLPLTDALLERLRNLSPRLRISHYPAHKVEEIPDDVWTRCEVLYTDRVLPDPEKAPNLRWIQFHFAGIDFAVDSPLLNNPEVTATTLSGAAASQMAEHILLMLLALGRRIPDLGAHQARAEWPKNRFERFMPKELRGSTVGLVGYGSIGRQVARLLQPFGAIVLAAKRNAMHPEDTGYHQEGMGDPDGDFFERLYPIQALDAMLKESDFIVVTVPLTQDTKGLIARPQFALMKPGAFLVDVSRGGVVDQDALLAALQDKRLGGAALDVFPEEPLPAASPLWKAPNLIITPHIAGNSPVYNERAVDLFAENLNRYLVGLPLYNRFDVNKGY